MTSTVRLAVLGHPIGHSLSPVMHEAGLAALGIEGRYDAIDVDHEGMAVQADRIRSGELTGANVTMPHKARAADLSDALGEGAARAHSVNTWVRDEGRLRGESTDIPGIVLAADRRNLPDGPRLVLGTGGAAAAAAVALDGGDLVVSGRSPDKAARLVERLGVAATVVEWGTGVEGCVVFNATPIGMRGERLPERVLGSMAALFDMAYGPAPTPAVSVARSQGLPTADGIDLLAAQAELSFERWIGRRPPEGLFESVARNASRAG